MPPLKLEGDTLGERHKHFNKLVEDAVNSKPISLTKINKDVSDINNLLQIDTACKTRNVDYIIEVLKCDDMLYVSRAIKHSTWLITEQQYAHIINPEYLYTELFPHMLTKAFNKLLLHIRLHLKDEKRVEQFYEYLKNVSKEAHKWLLNCSMSFIENVIQKEDKINLDIFKRLCRRSVKYLQYYTKVNNVSEWRVLEHVLFLLKTNTDEFLNILEAPTISSLPRFGPKYTELVMKKCPERILNNFQIYAINTDISIVAKYIKKDNIKDFLYKNIKNDRLKYFFNDSYNMKHFILNMSKDDRFEFVRKTYIDKRGHRPNAGDTILCCSDESTCLPSISIKMYQWYQYAPFTVAFIELKKAIRAESSPSERCAILSVLTSCARKNPQDIKTLLQYYYDKHRNEPYKFKLQFVNNVITQTTTHRFDSETWNILDKLFHSLEVYIDSEKDVQTCLLSATLYKVLHNEKMPDIVEKKITFDTFKQYQSKLNQEEQNKIFAYLLTFITNKIEKKTIINEADLIDALALLVNALELLKDWKKDIKEYPIVRDNILKLLKIKQANLWKTTFDSLYHVNKSWRKHMFEESMMLCPTEEVCLNILKHDPRLLTRHSDEVNTLRTDDKVSLRRLLSKLRVYWPDSLAQQWTESYFNNMNNSTGHKALIQGLIVLLPLNQVIDLAKKHVPKDPKIDWSEIDQKELNISKNIAKYLHIARPLVPLNVVLWYAIGDYLQFTLPSLDAVLHTISQDQSREHMSILLEAPVSLQKYGLHLAFMKLKHEELKPLFANIWKTTKNLTIRARLFNYIYSLLCKATETKDAKELWDILSLFIYNLSADDNKAIFSKLGNAKNVHISVRGEFYMKSYAFLTSQPASADCDSYISDMISYGSIIMDLLDGDLVADKMLAPIEEKISKRKCEFMNIIASYVLHGTTEDEQCERSRRILIPALEHIVLSWDTVKDDEYIMKDNFSSLLSTLMLNLKKFLLTKKMAIPVKLFSEIKSFMEQKMSMDEIYVKYTAWSLLLEYVKLIANHKDLCDLKLDNIPLSAYDKNWLPEEIEKEWEKIHLELSPELGPVIVKQLKEDTAKYFPTICWIFSEALSTFFSYLDFRKDLMKMDTLKYMIQNEDFIPCYILVCYEIPKHFLNNFVDKRIEIRRILSAHPSLEVQMHYHKAFEGISDQIL